MSDGTETDSVTLAEPTEARFSMRSLFIAMAVVALVSALVGPLVRNLEPEQQLRLIGVWGIWIAAIIIVIAYQARQRFEAERLAGSTLLRLRMFDEKSGSASTARRWMNIIGAGLILLFCMMMISGVVVDLSSRMRGGVSSFWSYLGGVGFWGLLSGWWAARLVTSLWWRDSIRFCEHGILWDRRFAGWDHLVQHRWDETKGLVLELKGIDQRTIDLALKVPVPTEQREAVQAVLDQKASGLHSTTMPSFLELGRVPISVAVKHPQFGRYLGSAILRIAIVAAAFIYIIQIPAMREFDRSMYPAIFLTAAVNLARWKWLGRSAGVPVVRLVGRRGWLAFVVPLGAMGICYFAGTNYSGTSPWPAYTAGIGFWCAALSAIGGLTARQLDLRTNGLVLQGLCYWPWDKVRVSRWDPDGKGRLVFARGWQRVVSIVPAEQRDAVDTLLTEKLR